MRLLPIHKGEGKQFCLLTFTGFLIAINYFLLRNLKDATITTHKDLGIEAIPFLKLWIVLPSIALFSIFCRSVQHLFSQKKIFQICVVGIVFYQLLFVFFLFPLAGSSPHLPRIVSHWPFSLFYLSAEMWGTAVMMILFWGLLNRITPKEQACRFWGPLLFLCNFAAVISGKLSDFIQKMFFTSSWQVILQIHVVLIALLSLLLLISHHVLSKQDLHPVAVEKKKTDGALTQKGAYFVYMVFGYYFCHSLMEVLWHAKVQQLYPKPEDFHLYLASVSQFIGWISCIGNLIGTTAFLRFVSVQQLVLVTPVVTSVFAVLFFCSPTVELAVVLGSWYFIASRTLKFVIFDPVKEISLSTLQHEEIISTKPLSDGIAPHLGKSGESLFLTCTICAFGSLQMGAMFLAMTFTLIKLGNIWSSFQISRHLSKKSFGTPQ